MEQQYIGRLADAYRKGYEMRHGSTDAGPGYEPFNFKVKSDLPRIEPVLGFIRGMHPLGKCSSILDVGTGRGVFVFPLLRDFPDMDVTSLDLLPHRIDMLQCVHDGGIGNLHPVMDDICRWDAPDKSFDMVTMLEVLEHIPDPESAVRNAIRMARNFVAVSVPSKPDANPEHIHLFSEDELRNLLLKNGCSKVKSMPVAGHHVMIAYLQ